jgi:hypothetical protein
MDRRRLTLTAHATVALAVIAAGSALVLAGSGRAAVAATDRHQAANPAPTTNSLLDGVAMAPNSSDAWVLVNTVVTAPYASRFTVAHRHNNHWRTLAVKGKPNAAVDLRGIAAASAKQVWAVGETISAASVDTPLLERSTGGSFKPVLVKGLASGAHLSAVAASSPTNAWVMGGSDDGSASFTLHWNGKKWAKSSLVVNGDVFTAYGLSISSPRSAWAVGDAGSTNVIIHWNGKKWSVNDTVPDGDLLNDIASSGARAWAVGTAEGTSGQIPLALRLTSSGWKPLVLEHAPAAYFAAVTAVGNTAYAVGRTTPVSPTAVQTPVYAKLHGATGEYGKIKGKGKRSTALDVAASTKAILAVGSYTPGLSCQTPTHPLAEALVRGTWKLSVIPPKVAPASKTGMGLCG